MMGPKMFQPELSYPCLCMGTAYFVCSVVLMVDEEYNRTRWDLTLNDVCLSSRDDVSIIAIILGEK